MTIALLISKGYNMRDVLSEAYNRCQIGSTTSAKPELEVGETLEVFQSFLDRVYKMELEGRILVKDVHRETQSGFRYVDHIMFKRLE